MLDELAELEHELELQLENELDKEFKLEQQLAELLAGKFFNQTFFCCQSHNNYNMG